MEEESTVLQSWFKWSSFNYSSEEPKAKRVCLSDGNPREEVEEETTLLLTRELGRARQLLLSGWAGRASSKPSCPT